MEYATTVYAFIINDSDFIEAIDSYSEKMKEEIENLLICDNTNSVKALEKLGVFSNNNKNVYECKWIKAKRNIKNNNKSWNKKMFYE